MAWPGSRPVELEVEVIFLEQECEHADAKLFVECGLDLIGDLLSLVFREPLRPDVGSVTAAMAGSSRVLSSRPACDPDVPLASTRYVLHVAGEDLLDDLEPRSKFRRVPDTNRPLLLIESNHFDLLLLVNNIESIDDARM